jgi:hypothetical protein
MAFSISAMLLMPLILAHGPYLRQDLNPTDTDGHVHFALKIAPSICMVRFTKRGKPGATMFNPWCKSTVVGYRLYGVQALPLVWTRILRLANSSATIARSPARRPRDGRATSGKTSGEISCVISAQLPCNGRTVATAMPPNIRQDDSQDNSRADAHVRAVRAINKAAGCNYLAARLALGAPIRVGGPSPLRVATGGQANWSSGVPGRRSSAPANKRRGHGLRPAPSTKNRKELNL